MTEQYTSDDIFKAITRQLRKDFNGSKNIKIYYTDYRRTLRFDINSRCGLELELYDKNREIEVYRRSLGDVTLLNIDCENVYIELKKIALEEVKTIITEDKAEAKALIKKQRELEKKYKLKAKSILEILRIKRNWYKITNKEKKWEQK